MDDDEAIRDTLRLVLEDAGYQVETVADGATALARMRGAQSPFIVLLDLIMPGMDGADVLDAAASDVDLTTRHVYILMTAAQVNLTTEVSGTLARMHAALLYKPFDLDVLLAMVAEARTRLG
ncbi:MAG: response regulator [Acetobacteraceae bacterium]